MRKSPTLDSELGHTWRDCLAALVACKGRWCGRGMDAKVALAVGVTLLTLALMGCGAGAKPALEKVGSLDFSDGIQSMAWHPDGRQLAVGYYNRNEVEVWDVQTGKPLFAVPSKRRPVNQSGQEMLFSPDGQYLVVQDFLDTKNGDHWQRWLV